MSKPQKTDLSLGLQEEIGNAIKLLTKPINISSFTGKDDYILAYDEINGEFYLKADEGGGGGSAFFTILPAFSMLNLTIPLTTTTIPAP